MFGGIVKQISKKIFMLKTGNVYEIEGKKIFAFGGATSIDKANRIPFVSWWPQEVPTMTDYRIGMENLDKVNKVVDIIFTHATHNDCYEKTISLLPVLEDKIGDPTISMLQSFRETIDYGLWVGGHYHLNCYDYESRTAILYNLVISYDELKKIVDSKRDSFLISRLGD